MKPEIVLMGGMMPHVMEALEAAYAVHRYDQAADKAAFLAEVAETARGVVTGGHHGDLDNAVVDALPKLEVISSFGVGVDHIDVGHAAGRGVVVANTPGVLNDEVANLAVALILMCSRQLVAADRYLRSGQWLEGAMPLQQAIRGKTVGILGLGRIGKDIAAKLQVFGCEVVYNGRREQAGQPYRYYADLVAMAKDSDYLVVICPGGPETEGIIDRAVLDALGPEGTLINVARGSVVDEPALVAALAEGRLGGAGLDVFAEEPKVPQALIDLDHVVLLPHVGSATVQTRKAMGDLVVDNLAGHFAGTGALTPVAAD